MESRFNNLIKFYNNENFSTPTSSLQIKVEKVCFKIYRNLREKFENIDDALILNNNLHRSFLRKSLYSLPRTYEVFDVSKPWLLYWIIHSAAMLKNEDLFDSCSQTICDFLKTCENKDTGGYGGGPDQLAHLATTYAAVNAIVSLNNPEALQTINRDKLLCFLKSMKRPNGSFMMHLNGEKDIRGAYCAISIATICNLKDETLFEKTPEWIASCQTYEGGFGPCPNNEAHGGHTFCGTAALILLNKINLVDTDALLRWTIKKQMTYEGGFSGRTNKLVDGCYSFWQGSVFALLHFIVQRNAGYDKNYNEWLFNQEALQEYLLLFCQDNNGGLIDKPFKKRDLYHTCYDLSGLSISQNSLNGPKIIGDPSNHLMPVDPRYNLTYAAVFTANKVFQNG